MFISQLYFLVYELCVHICGMQLLKWPQDPQLLVFRPLYSTSHNVPGLVCVTKGKNMAEVMVCHFQDQVKKKHIVAFVLRSLSLFLCLCLSLPHHSCWEKLPCHEDMQAAQREAHMGRGLWPAATKELRPDNNAMSELETDPPPIRPTETVALLTA